MVTRNGERRDVLIKDLDWKKTPSSIRVKDDENASPVVKWVDELREFGSGGMFRFIRSGVRVDQSSGRADQLTSNPNPDWSTDTLLLRQLVDGTISLYVYRAGGMVRYFYQEGSDSLRQFVQRSYLTGRKRIAENNAYQEQLLTLLGCSELSAKQVLNTDYLERELITLFAAYHECANLPYRVLQPDRSASFRLSLRPRVERQSLEVTGNLYPAASADFGAVVSPAIGVQLGYVLPFNRGKWMVFAEPTLRRFSGSKSTRYDAGGGEPLAAEVSYTALELAAGIQHQFFLSDKLQLHLNLLAAINLPLGSSFEYRKSNGEVGDRLHLPGRMSFGGSAGLAVGKRWSLELRHYLSREILQTYLFWDSEYELSSLIVGYRLR
jgi:hypothetical protein